MKALPIAVITAVAGCGLGFLVTPPSGSVPTELSVEKPASPRRASESGQTTAPAKPSPATRMQSVAEKAAELTAAEWPAFFRAQLKSPDTARIAARLWAESDPAGFWKWLKQERDPLLLDRFAEDLVRLWVTTDPDAVMDAMAEVTDKTLGDRLRETAIDLVFETDLQKGLEMAGRAGNFANFSFGAREWMKQAPEAAVKGLASLSPLSDYRQMLMYALPIWAEKDPMAALEWMKKQPPGEKTPWVTEGTKKAFQTAAKNQPQAALGAAREIADVKQRGMALAGVVAAGSLSIDELGVVLKEIPIPLRANIANDMLRERPANTVADLQASAEVLNLLPPNHYNLDAVDSLAGKWRRIDREAGLRWAESLPDITMKRAALKELQRKN